MAGHSSHITLPSESTPLLNSQSTMSTMESTQSDNKNSLKNMIANVPTGDTSIREGSIDDVPALDNAILKAQGHDAAMSRSFSMLSALGLGFSITNSWVGYLSNFDQNLTYGGPQVVVFGLIVAFAVQWTITLGLSELASAFQSSGGQYHFVFILAPEETRRFAAFVVGWMSILAWWIVTCSGVSLAVVSLAGMGTFWNESYQQTQWQIYLIYVEVALLTVLPLFVCPKQVPMLAPFTLYLFVPQRLGDEVITQ